MKTAPVIIAPERSTPGFLTSGHLKKRSIPPDLLREASKRLGIMCMMAAILSFVATVLWEVTWPSLHPGQQSPGLTTSEILSYGITAVSLVMWLIVRRKNARPEIFLKMGLIYMIVIALMIGLVMHVGLPTSEPMFTQISWLGVITIMFAAVLPMDPKTMLIASLIAVSMSPLSMMISHVHGLTTMGALKAGLLMHYPDYLLACSAAAISAVVTQLGRQVTKAREMGSYQLGDLIKRGGMGEIYRATHRMLARPAAIKLIRPEMLGSEGDTPDIAVKRFHREAEAAANLRSPHTVELFDFGVTEDQTLYFVMELLDGVDLESLVRETGPLPARRVIHILRQACESLAEAHEKGLVHRDIKPANIHLGKAGVRHDYVKVLDFGLVKSVQTEQIEDSLATAVGRTPGTPAYMAPEMALSEPIDGRADLYALGCVGYFLLTGHIVFDGTSAFQIVAKHLRNDPVPPSLRSRVQIPPALEAVILKCLAKKPADRYATAMDMSAALSRVPEKQWSDEEARDAWTKRAPVKGGELKSPEAREALHAV
jgi:serine/threonine-protein kinase